MTRNELLSKWCAAEKGKKSALDAPQARECYAKLRQIIGEETGVDIDDIIAGKCLSLECSGITAKADLFEAFRTYAWRAGKPVK